VLLPHREGSPFFPVCDETHEVLGYFETLLNEQKYSLLPKFIFYLLVSNCLCAGIHFPEREFVRWTCTTSWGLWVSVGSTVLCKAIWVYIYMFTTSVIFVLDVSYCSTFLSVLLFILIFVLEQKDYGVNDLCTGIGRGRPITVVLLRLCFYLRKSHATVRYDAKPLRFGEIFLKIGNHAFETSSTYSNVSLLARCLEEVTRFKSTWLQRALIARFVPRSSRR